MNIKFKTEFNISYKTTIMDLENWSTNMYSDYSFLPTILAIKLGICYIEDCTGNHIDIDENGDVFLHLKTHQPIMDILENHKLLKVDKELKKYYVPSKAGFFRTYLDKEFGIYDKDRWPRNKVEKLLGEE